MKNNSRLVYSTDQGRIKEQKQAVATAPGDGIIRLRRETKGRKGKGVTLCDGFQLSGDELKKLAKTLKQLCGVGGAVKGGIIEIQGDQRDKLKAALEDRGFTTKIAGG